MKLANSLFILMLSSVLFSCENEAETVLKAQTDEELSGGANLTTFDFSENAFGNEGKGFSSSELTDFVVGNSVFRSNWVIAPSSVQSLDGVGPLMNSISCGGCHFKDGRARPPDFAGENVTGMLFRLSIPGAGPHNEPISDPLYGGQLQDKGIMGVDAEAQFVIQYQEVTGTYRDGNTYSLRKPEYSFSNLKYGSPDGSVMISPRIAQQITGLGLLENVDEQTILSYADESDANGDGISGRPNYVWSEQTQTTVLGRFGWKANQPSIIQQTASAFNGDMGITTSIFPIDGLTDSQRTQYTHVPDGGEPELDDKRLKQVELYIRALAVPARRNWTNNDILRGKQIFNELNCSQCHLAELKTGSGSNLNSLNEQTIRPYTDLLLHDMGAGLADNRTDFLATGTEWRTPPLWGIGLIKTVNGHTTLLHDGRARNIEEAILWHGGEAAKSVSDFKELSASERQSVIKFIESL
jgi:CxxC motif-containing protein (DUF1111 family)